MKKSTYLFIVIIAFMYSCKKSELKKTLIFSGKIENPNSTTLKIKSGENTIKSILLNKDNTFRDTLNLAEGFYRLSDKKEYTRIYLKPGYDVHLTLNTKEFDESIQYEGKGANENNYLAKKILLEDSFGKLDDVEYYVKLSEKEFLKLSDSLYKIKKNLLEQHIDLDKDFAYIESKSLEFYKLATIYGYAPMRRIITGSNDFKVSEHYPNVFENTDVSNEKLIISPGYLGHINTYFYEKSRSETTKNQDSVYVDYTLEILKKIQEEVKSNLIKDKLVYAIIRPGFKDVKNLDSVFNQIKSMLTNEKYLSEATEKYNQFKKIEKGAISPIFQLNDINGASISLNDLKGKVVYIDVWATWCVPCIKEIPSLKKMEEHFKNKDIQFVSICAWDKEKRWKKMVEDKKLGGIQLFIPDEKKENEFLKNYSIESIPRFILIDKNGKIIDANAKRPSHPELQKEIEDYLQKYS